VEHRRDGIGTPAGLNGQLALVWGDGAADRADAADRGAEVVSPKALLTIAEAAAMLSIGRSTAYGLIAAGRLEVVHIGRSARVPLRAIDDFVRDLRQRPA
jgi:excisionase family DNA binding protein